MPSSRSAAAVRLAAALFVALAAPASAQWFGKKDDRAVKVVEGQEAGVNETRVALVIGNSKYRDVPLRNPENDANDMAAALRQLGFEVMLERNIDHVRMEDAIREFGKKLRKGGVGLFYYAGHGVQVNGQNYLIPVGARIEAEKDVKYHAVDLGQVLDEFASAKNRLNILVLDACRDNPFRSLWRSTSAGAGLAKTDAPRGTLVAYATSPGSVAADGSGRNGIYTSHLLREMARPGLTIEQVFKGVRIGVVDETGGRQTPWESSSLTGDFYFKIAPPDVAPTPPPQVAMPGKSEFKVDDLLAEAKERWAKRQQEMREVVDSARSYEKQDLPPDVKAQVWQRFLDAYPDDDPNTREDDQMREEARKRVAYWKIQPAQGGKQYAVDDIIEEGYARWEKRLAEMTKAHAEATDNEKKNLQSDLKAKVWQRFLEAYAADNPHSKKDDDLRENARQRLDYWSKQEIVSSPGSIDDVLVEADKRWARRLVEMKEVAEKARGYERRDLPADVKAQVWQRFLDGYADDNPNSKEDDGLRREAAARVAHWKAEAAKAPAKPDLDAVAAAAASPADARAAAEQTLARYREAYRARDFEGLKKVWVMNPQQQTAMQALFECADSIEVELVPGKIEAAGPSASVDFDQTLDFSGPRCLMKTGKTTSKMTAMVMNTGNQWIITSILPRR
jgi:uncharacterized caspase-like protein